MNLKRLDYFCQLVDTGNFTKAARQIGIAQPALSIAIKNLEKELGLKLINRAEKNSLLTAEGKVLHQSARKILAQAKQIKQELQEMKDLSRGSIKLGVSAMMGSYYFPQVLTVFKQEYPHITINLIDQGTSTLEKMLLNGELDIAAVNAQQKNQQLRYSGIIEEEIVAGVNATHPLANKKSITLKQFCSQPLVLFHEDYFLREAISKYSKKFQIDLDLRMETNLIELLKSLVRNEVGITTCLPMILEDEPDIIAIPFNPRIKLKLGLAWKKSHYLSQASKTFIDFMNENLLSGTLHC